MTANIIIKELSPNDINENSLDIFERYQKVDRGWVYKDTSWVLTDLNYEVDWDKTKKDNLIKYFQELLQTSKGHIFGAFINNYVIGFSVLLNRKIGSEGQYIQLKYLHLSKNYRHKGIGKKLFQLCVEKTKEIGGSKIYISANDSEATQNFYLGIGCKDAEEIDLESAKAEPYDRQMEYIV